MSAVIKTLSFAARQDELPACYVVNLKFAEGDLRAEYVSASELQKTDGSWAYSFLINELDLPAGLTMDEVRNANIIAPYWECPEVTPPSEDECPARAITCFDSITSIDNMGEGDEVAVLVFDEECEKWCLRRISKSYFEQEAITVLDALDYEAFLPSDELTAGMTTYVTHMPREFLAEDGLRVSVAQEGTGSVVIRVLIDGLPLLDSDVTLTGMRTIVIPMSGFDAAWDGSALEAGAVITAEIVSATYVPYGTNWQGLRLAFLGRAIS